MIGRGAFAIILLIGACARPAAPAPALANRGGDPSLPSGGFATRALRGPYRSVHDWCTDLARRQDGVPGCAPHAGFVSAGETALGPSGGAITAVALMPMETSTVTSCALILHVGARVWVDEDAVPCLPAPGQSTAYRSVSIDHLDWIDLIDHGPPEEAIGNELRLIVSTSYDGGPAIENAVEMIVCGVGRSRAPRCTPSIPVSIRGEIHVDTRADVASDGTLRFTVADRHGDLDADELARYARPLQLRFP